MTNNNREEYVHPLDILKIAEEKNKALKECYLDLSKIPDYLQEGLIDREQAREAKRSHIFDEHLRDNYFLELDSALRAGEVTYEEYCEHSRRYYLKYNRRLGDQEGILNDDWMEHDDTRYDPDEDAAYIADIYWDIIRNDGGFYHKRRERSLEFELIDFRSPHQVSQMPEYEVIKAVSIFSSFEKRYSGKRGINKHLEFITDLNAVGFKLPKDLNKILCEARKCSENDEPFKMSKLRLARIKNQVNRYAQTFWLHLLINRPEVYRGFKEL